MWTSSRFSAATFILLSVACSGRSSPGGANENGPNAGNSSGGTSGGNSSGFCVLGAQGCPCDATGACLHGLSCNGSTCCDAATGSCSASSDQGSTGSGTGASTGTGTGGTGTGTGTSSGGTSANPGDPKGPGDPNAPGGPKGSGSSGSSGSEPASVCTPGVVGPVITDCGYPYSSNNPLTAVAFNESEVLRAIAPSGGAPLASVRLFYNDEHALTLGVRNVTVQSSTGATSHDFPVSELASNPSAVRSPQTGTNDLVGNEAGVDPVGRPMWPALFVTDTTTDANAREGDWQMGGTAWNPSAVFGTWKAAVRSVDTTVTPNVTTVTPDADPAKNDWNLGGGDPIPASLTSSSAMMGMGMGMGMTDQGYGAEARWDLVLVPGHSYRIQVMVHDGDQNQVGGDAGEACVNFCADAACPDYSVPCSTDSPCPIETESICVNGCCI